MKVIWTKSKRTATFFSGTLPKDRATQSMQWTMEGWGEWKGKFTGQCYHHIYCSLEIHFIIIWFGPVRHYLPYLGVCDHFGFPSGPEWSGRKKWTNLTISRRDSKISLSGAGGAGKMGGKDLQTKTLQVPTFRRKQWFFVIFGLSTTMSMSRVV